MLVNKNMKFLTKIFYNILINCEDYKNKSFAKRNLFLLSYLTKNDIQKDCDSTSLVDYFDKYQAFCFDLSLDSVSKGDLNFNYKPTF